MMSRSLLTSKITIATAMILLSVSSARADLELTISDGSSAKTYDLTTNPAPTSYKGYSFTVAGTSSYVAPTESLVLSVSGLTVGNGTNGKGKLTFTLSDIVSNPQGNLNGALGYVSTSGNPNYFASGVANGSGIYEGSTTSLGNITGPYTLSSTTSLTGLQKNVTYAFATTATVTALPEPGSIAAAAMGLPCMATLLSLVRRRMKLGQSAAV